jgi:hypothetical protein
MKVKKSATCATGNTQFTQAAAIQEAPAPKEAKEKDRAPPGVGLPAMAALAPSKGTETALAAGEARQAPAAAKSRSPSA